MQSHQVQLVRNSFALVQPIAPQAAALFYNILFATDPALRQLFRGDMAQQGERLMGMIASAVRLLDQPEVLMPVLRGLGQRHGGYGVLDAHYATVGGALLLTLEQGLGEAFTPEVHEAWTAVYGLISRTMIEASNEATVEAVTTV